MTLIHDVFAQYTVATGDSPQTIWQKNVAFKQLINQLSTQMGPSWGFVMWLSFQGMRHTRPEMLEEVWHSWGLDYVEDVVTFVSGFDKINTNEIIQDIQPTLNIDLTQRDKINSGDLKNIIKDQCFCTSNCTFHYTDAHYYLPTKDDLDNLMQYSKLPQLKYIPESRDCDDYAHMFRSWLAFMGIGNLAIAYVEVSLQGYNGQNIGAHAINACILEDKTVLLIEPQNSFTWNPKVGEAGMEVSKQILYRVEF